MAPLLARRPAADRAFERLYQRHVRDVYRYAHAVLRNPDDAEDVTQTTFMNAYRAFQRGARPEQPKNWLIAIAHNVCRQRFRQLQRRPSELPLYEDAAEMAVEEPDDAFTAEDIQRALGQLAFNQRAALVMRELEGRSYAEIAEIIGLSVGAVETLIFRARRALREQLEGQLTCGQAELALSKQTDGVLSRSERGQLRAHLRECKDCASLARRHRATRGALRALGAIPLPASLTSLFGGGGSAVTAGVAAKAAAVVFAGSVVGTAGYVGSTHVDVLHAKARSAVPAHPHTAKTVPPLRPASKTVAAAAPARDATRAVTHVARPTPAAAAATRAHARAAANHERHGLGHRGVVGGKPVQHDTEVENPVRATPELENPMRPVHEAEHPVSRAAKPKPEPVHVHPAAPVRSHRPATNPGATHGSSKKKSAPEETTAREPTHPAPTTPSPGHASGNASPGGNGHGGGGSAAAAEAPATPTVPAATEPEPPISDEATVPAKHK